MKNALPDKRLALLAMIAIFIAVGQAGSANNDFRVSPPGGRDIRSIKTAADLRLEDIETLQPESDGIRYYFDKFDSTRKNGDVTFIKTEIYFITLLPLDYTGMDRFATSVLAADGGLKTVDGVMATMPNLMEYLGAISTGDIERHIETSGRFQRVTLVYTLDKKALAGRYPDVSGMITRRLIHSFSAELLNRDGELLVRFELSGDKIAINFLLDPHGYFVATGPDGEPLPQRGKRLGLEDARRGVKLYLDISFDTRVSLLKIFRLCRIEVKRVRVQVDLKQNPNRLGIAWQVIDVVPGEISVTGFNSEPVSLTLLHMKGALKGTLDFQPIKNAAGECLTFMRAYGAGEQIDYWLVDLALLTWEQIGQQAMTDLSLPISDVLLAVQRDIILQSGNPVR